MPLSPFCFFSQETRKKIKEEHPDIKQKAIIKIVKEKWRRMCENEKDSYNMKSFFNKDEYR